MSELRDFTEKHPRYSLDVKFYDEVRAAKAGYRLMDKFSVPPYSGLGFTVKKGQTFRIIEEEGPQIVDIAIWNANNHKEGFNAYRNRLIEGGVIRLYSRLWSEVPWLRPMATCIEDQVESRTTDDKYHHHFPGGHCASEQWELLVGKASLNSCHLNLLQAVEPFGLKEEQILTNFMVHEKDYLDPVTGIRYMLKGDAKPGDYIEFYAEMDLLIAVSVCPSGDGAVYYPDHYRKYTDYGPEEEGLVRPLGIEVYDTGIQPREFPKWTEWRKH